VGWVFRASGCALPLSRVGRWGGGRGRATRPSDWGATGVVMPCPLIVCRCSGRWCVSVAHRGSLWGFVSEWLGRCGGLPCGLGTSCWFVDCGIGSAGSGR